MNQDLKEFMDEMTICSLKAILESAAKALFENQKDIFDFVSETHQTEWNLAHHLANEIQKFFQDYACDLDIIKAHFEYRRPDIVFHKRGSHESNFLVIEIKRDGNQSGIDDDIKKIKSHWFKCPLCYRFGSVINLKCDKTYEVNVFKNPQLY